MKIPEFSGLPYTAFGTTYTADLYVDTYATGGGLAIQLAHEAPEGFTEPLATVTLNVYKPAPEGCIWIKDYSENEGMAEWAICHGIVEPTVVDAVASGWVMAEAYKLTEKFLAAIAAHLAKGMPR